MFSTSTTASSTISPMAIASPPSVMVLIDRPAKWKTMAAVRIDTGIAVSEITVVRTFSRKAKRTTATTAVASSSTVRTLPIEVSMKLAWRNRMLSARMPEGSVRDRSASAASTSRVRRTVSMSGCFSTEMITDGLPI